MTERYTPEVEEAITAELVRCTLGGSSQLDLRLDVEAVFIRVGRQMKLLTTVLRVQVAPALANTVRSMRTLQHAMDMKPEDFTLHPRNDEVE